MSTPLRRSTRLKAAETPELTASVKLGPRQMARLKREQKKLEAENILNKTAPAPETSKNNVHSSARRSRRRSMVIQPTEDIKPIEVLVEIKSEIPQKTPEQSLKRSLDKKKTLSHESSQEEASTASSSVVSTASENTTVIENIESSVSTIKTEQNSFKQENDEIIENEEKLDDVSLIDLSDETPAKVQSFAQIVKTASFESAEQIENSEPPNGIIDSILLLDPKEEKHSIENETIPKSPTVENRERLDETFSPVIDDKKSIANDSRPHIELPSIVEPVTSVTKSVSNRTSTPFVSKSIKRQSLVMAKDSVEDSENDSVFIRNPLEKSILKGARRKRSMSCGVFEMEVSNRKVMFVSPKVMEIDKIDERMMASFISEKEMENSVKKQPRKRSLSVGSKSVERSSRTRKMPDFKAIHEQNFNKMESIDQHMKRKADRAKRLLTPDSKKKTETKESKIPKMTATTSNINERPKFTFSSTALPPRIQAPKTPTALKPKNVQSNIQKPKFEIDVKPIMPIIKSEDLKPSKIAVPSQKVSAAVANRIKVEERRERNFSLYKTNHVQRATNDVRQKNLSILKGVRLNRRFELQMQQRQKKDS